VDVNGISELLKPISLPWKLNCYFFEGQVNINDGRLSSPVEKNIFTIPSTFSSVSGEFLTQMSLKSYLRKVVVTNTMLVKLQERSIRLIILFLHGFRMGAD
jgi:hypothetical protein